LLNIKINRPKLSFLPLQVSIFNKSDCLDFIANDGWLQFTQPQSTGLSGVGAMLETKAATEAKTSFRVLKCTLVNLVCVIGENH